MSQHLRRPAFVTEALAHRREFTEIAIVHVDDGLRTRVVLTADDVRRFADESFLSSDPWIVNEFATSTASTAMVESPGIVDARWIVTFRDAARRDRFTMVLDRFGRRANVQARAVAIDGGPLVRLLRQVTTMAERTPFST